MLTKNFNKWPITPIANNVLNGLKIYIPSFEYLEKVPSQFVELPDNSIKKENGELMGLDKQALFPNNK